MSDDIDTKEDVTAYSEKHVAPNFKRRQLIFDSFAKLKHGTSSRTANDGGPKGGTLLYAWGAGYHGQLGLEAKRKKCEMIPVQINFNEAVIQISCGGFHTGLVTEQGKVYTWGDGRQGQLGNLESKYNMHPTPHLVDDLVHKNRATIVDLSCGQYHTACVSAKGDLYTWGSGKYGQIGHGDKSMKRKPVKVLPNKQIGCYAKVACGDKHTVCLTTSKKVVTFGSGQHGQLGHGGESQKTKKNAGQGLDELKPRLIADMLDKDVKWIAAGATVTSVVTVEGEMWLWGFGESIHPKDTPNIVYNPRRVDFFVEKQKEVIVQVGIGQSHIVVLTEGGDVWAFGNLYIKRSVSASEAAVANVRVPRLILKRENVREISCGRYHTMCLTEHGVMYSWGVGESGQLGHNKLQSNEFPQLVEYILPNVVGKIACGDHHSFCLSSIRFHEVHPEAKKWKRLQDQLLQRKMEIRRSRKELSEGLRTKQILEIDRERETMILEEKQAQKKADEQQKKLLTVQLESIQMRSQIEDMVKTLKQAKKKVKKIKQREMEEEQEKRAARNQQKKKGASSKKRSSQPLISGRAPHGEQSADGTEDLPFQPLMPRIGFMETTQKTLLEVKKQTDTFKSGGLSVVKPNVNKFLRELFDQKKEYNRLCEDNKHLLIRHDKLKKELSFMRPTDDDLTQKKRNKKILDDLKMKLVTKDTQLMETEENKSNYNLYIIRMKEENLVTSKSIDHLRHMVREYDRLITKLNKVCHRVNGQRTHIQDEIGNFSKDIRSFSNFASEQLSRYRQMMNSTAKAKKLQKQSQIEREAKMNNRKKKLMRKLIIEHDTKQKEAEAIEKEKEKFEKKVEYYTHRFRKISEATGLNEPEDIIDKFFSNDKISDDLMADIKSKKTKVKEIEKEMQSVSKDIDEKKSNFKMSKWRDVSQMERSISEESKRVKKLSSECERIDNRMLVIKEGVNSLLAGVQIATGEDEQYENDLLTALETLREKISRAWDIAKPQMKIASKKAKADA
mmetsp:Transcript_2438/g.3550  ORF Transcript_2438/g.3550 Transcript_2438/m.3550 type:complete len:1010 (-) Transcript_2438:272-3301(-)|eukprot:CAMPEP_0184491144 /NCGR_PEP_ID=MMETSP0113_2-20130426/19701_1 /TAXON_ID=91329 /ORGANISM="Norrisiella sphaerica, Strain BC52" /LENGTH=1009 /DNA_ID=CAMNT_0026875387 /DNA_START=118 /DNA_END=3147 /DNA_ORIENTATION=+